MDNDGIVAMINRAAPDILLISLGSPKQENWMSMNFAKLNVPIIIGVGGTIDFLSGSIPRAPEWMKTLSLEWIWRLRLEPRRLAKRYAIDLRDGVFPLFFQATVDKVARSLSTSHNTRNGKQVKSTSVVLGIDGAGIRTTIVEPECAHQVCDWRIRFMQAPADDIDAIILDLVHLNLLDSSVVSEIVILDRYLRARAQQLVIVADFRGRFSLYLARMLDMLVVVRNLDDAKRRILSVGRHSFRASTVPSMNGVMILQLAGELTTYTTHLLTELRTPLREHPDIVLDVSNLHALDAAGLRHLIEVWKSAREGDEKIPCVVGTARWAKAIEVSGPRRHLSLFNSVEEALRSSFGTKTDHQGPSNSRNKERNNVLA
jgi:anti-anti-sigma factor